MGKERDHSFLTTNSLDFYCSHILLCFVDGSAYDKLDYIFPKNIVAVAVFILFRTHWIG